MGSGRSDTEKVYDGSRSRLGYREGLTGVAVPVLRQPWKLAKRNGREI